jgi:hypothetical protein
MDRDDTLILLRVVWIYADEGLGFMPDGTELLRMEQFEDRLCDTWEASGNAILTAVLTLDGAKQFVFYAQDVSQCSELLNRMPQEEQPYPIELDAQNDPDFSYLRNKIVADRT